MAGVVGQTRVVHCRRTHRGRDFLYIGRGGRWGNPFKIGDIYQARELTREDAIEAFRDWLLHSDAGIELLNDLPELKGKKLGCWCAPLACHGDVYVELVEKYLP